MNKIAEDRFETFLPLRESVQIPLNLIGLMKAIMARGNISIEAFWKMPLSLVLEMLGVFEPPDMKAISRKTLVDQEKYFNRLGYGD